MKNSTEILLYLVNIFALAMCYAAYATPVDAQADCKKWLGRPAEFICEQKGGYDECVAKLQKGEANFCVLSGKDDTRIRRISTADAITDLNKSGCQRAGLSGNFSCSDLSAYNACISYKNYGAVTSCTKSDAKSMSGNLFVFAIFGADDTPKPGDARIWMIQNIGGKWGEWSKTGNYPDTDSSGLDACSPNPGEVVMFYQSKAKKDLWWNSFKLEPSGNLKEDQFNHALMSTVGSAPTVACEPGRFTLFVRMVNNLGYVSNIFSNGTWQSMRRTSQVPRYTRIELVDNYKGGGAVDGPNSSTDILGGRNAGGTTPGFDSNPDAIVAQTKTIVFARSKTGSTIWAHVRGVEGWTEISSTKMTSNPTAVYLSKRKAVWVFARGADNRLWATQITNLDTLKASVWLPWGDRQIAGEPDASTMDGNRVDVVARGADGRIIHFWRDDDEALVKLAQFEILPSGPIVSDPTIVAGKW